LLLLLLLCIVAAADTAEDVVVVVVALNIRTNLPTNSQRWQARTDVAFFCSARSFFPNLKKTCERFLKSDAGRTIGAV
jgi:hypothetical protein